jgi:hypothetical protein
MVTRKWKKSWSGAFVIVIFAILNGCGYHFQQTGKIQGLEIRSLAIPMVKSPSSNLGFEGIFTRVVREEFIDHSELSVVPRENADAVLEMRVTRIETDPLTYAVTQTRVQDRAVNYATTSSRWLRIILDARLIDRVSGKTLWAQNGMHEKGSYAVTADPLKTRYYRDLALSTIARSLAKKMYAQTMERF